MLRRLLAISLIFLACLPIAMSEEKYDPEGVTSSKALFYGIVVDQNAQPVPGAMIRVEIRRGGAITGHRSDFVDLKSAADGQFKYDGGTRANQLHITTEKEGYAGGVYTAILSPMENPEERYVPDEAHPHPIVMWKSGPPQTITRYRCEYRIRYHVGDDLRLDAGSGRFVLPGDSADLLIKIVAPTDLEAWLRDVPKGADKWTVHIEPIKGSLRVHGGRDLMEPFNRPGVSKSDLNQPNVEWTEDRDTIIGPRLIMFSANDDHVFGRLRFDFRWEGRSGDAQREGWLSIAVSGDVNPSNSPDLTPDPDHLNVLKGKPTYVYEKDLGYREEGAVVAPQK